MSGMYFDAIISRATERVPVVLPRRLSRFEPTRLVRGDATVRIDVDDAERSVEPRPHQDLPAVATTVNRDRGSRRVAAESSLTLAVSAVSDVAPGPPPHTRAVEPGSRSETPRSPMDAHRVASSEASGSATRAHVSGER